MVTFLVVTSTFLHAHVTFSMKTSLRGGCILQTKYQDWNNNTNKSRQYGIKEVNWGRMKTSKKEEYRKGGWKRRRWCHLEFCGQCRVQGDTLASAPWRSGVQSSAQIVILQSCKWAVNRALSHWKSDLQEMVNKPKDTLISQIVQSEKCSRITSEQWTSNEITVVFRAKSHFFPEYEFRSSIFTN